MENVVPDPAPANGASSWIRDLRQVALLVAAIGSTGALGTGWYQSSERTAAMRATKDQIAIERDEEQAVAASCIDVMRITNEGYHAAVQSEHQENEMLYADVKRLRAERDQRSVECIDELRKVQKVCHDMVATCEEALERPDANPPF